MALAVVGGIRGATVAGPALAGRMGSCLAATAALP